MRGGEEEGVEEGGEGGREGRKGDGPRRFAEVLICLGG